MLIYSSFSPRLHHKEPWCHIHLYCRKKNNKRSVKASTICGKKRIRFGRKLIIFGLRTHGIASFTRQSVTADLRGCMAPVFGFLARVACLLTRAAPFPPRHGRKPIQNHIHPTCLYEKKMSDTIIVSGILSASIFYERRSNKVSSLVTSYFTDPPSKEASKL